MRKIILLELPIARDSEWFLKLLGLKENKCQVIHFFKEPIYFPNKKWNRNKTIFFIVLKTVNSQK